MEYFDMDCPCQGKNLDKMIQPLILNILYKGPTHGFVIVQKLGESTMFRGSEPDKAGVYRYLKKMEASGSLTSYWDTDGEGGKPRRIYSITDKGRECLLNWMVALRQYAIGIYSMVEEIENTLRDR